MLRTVLAVASLFAAQTALDSYFGQTASAQGVGEMRYGIVTIHNATDSPINYSYRIGDGPWTKTTIEPGYHRYYWHKYSFVNENRSPIFQIRFDSDMGRGVAIREFDLERNPAPYVSADLGRHYYFRYLAGNQISLYND
jgi:hypothetical protein